MLPLCRLVVAIVGVNGVASISESAVDTGLWEVRVFRAYWRSLESIRLIDGVPPSLVVVEVG